MCDIFNDNSDNEDIEFANKDWIKMSKDFEKDGFRDGIQEGRTSGLQKAFDLGFQLSFKPFSTISSFEAIIDVLLSKTKDNEEMSSQLKTIKVNVIKMYELIDCHLDSMGDKELDTKSMKLSEEVIDLFETSKQNTIKICNEFNLSSILQLIKQLDIC